MLEPTQMVGFSLLVLEVTFRAVGTAPEKGNFSFAYTDVEFN